MLYNNSFDFLRTRSHGVRPTFTLTMLLQLVLKRVIQPMDDPSLVYPLKTLTDVLTPPGTSPISQVLLQEHHGKEINAAYGTGSSDT